MIRLVSTLLAAWACVLATSMPAPAQSFVTVRPEPTGTAWWLRAEFHALHDEIRGIPVKRIRADWCKATEFKRELFPKGLLVENGYDLLASAKLDFALEGAFDGSGSKQTALVGVYETCAGQKGRFLLIIDAGTRKLRFLDAEATNHQFTAIGKVPGGALQVAYCLECDVGSIVKWDRNRKRFAIK
jgi:hypothetical protein